MKLVRRLELGLHDTEVVKDDVFNLECLLIRHDLLAKECTTEIQVVITLNGS